MITNNNFVKLKNKFNIGLLIGFALLVIGFILIFLGGNKQVKNEENAVYFNDIILNDSEDNVGQFSYLDVSNNTYRFAQYGDDDDYCYFVYDNNYYYIVRMSEKKYKELFKEGLESVRLEGTVYKTTDEIKDLAIDEFNSIFEEDIVNLGNFESYFGDVYLNLNNTTASDASIYMIFGFLVLFTGIPVIIIFIIKKIGFNKVMKRLTEMDKTYINSELESSDMLYFSNLKLFLTNNYIINFKGKFFILKYSDIIWMYPHDYYYNGFKSYQEMRFMTKDGKNFSMARATTKNQILNYNSVWNYITNKNTTILLGFTSENKVRAKEIVKNNKI